MSEFRILREGTLSSVGSLAEAMGVDDPASEPVAFVTAHDDDSPIGLGMTMARAVEEGFDVHVVVATDGRMGYCTADQKDSIAEIRAGELRESLEVLGVPASNLRILGFGDGVLYNYVGRRPAGNDDPAVEGFTGLENQLVAALRAIRPAHVFTPAGTDLHPDHQAVYKELLISIFHAGGAIWPELGDPCDVPQVWEFPTYVKLSGNPEIMHRGDDALFKRKLDAVACYRSQLQIGAITGGIKAAPPVEFFRNTHFEVYRPTDYLALFEE